MKNSTVRPVPKEKRLIDAKALSLEDWLELVLKPKPLRDYRIEDSHFATISHLDEYLADIHNRSEDEVLAVLRLFLIEGGYLGIDNTIRRWLFSMSPDEAEQRGREHSYFRRLLDLSGDTHPWHGNTWVLDLLPHFPREAIAALDSFFLAHCQLLPDGRLNGLSDAITIIRHRYLEHPLPVKETLLELVPRNFELLVGYLFKKSGYKVTVTPRGRDGGYDVLAVRSGPRAEERLHVECKRYTENVGVRVIRATLGTLAVTTATRAVVVTSSGFTRDARKEAAASKRIELIDAIEFDKDMRKHVDANWTARLPRYINKMKQDVLAETRPVHIAEPNS